MEPERSESSPELAGYADLAADVRRLPARLGSTRLVVVDGPAGACKTTFAERLAGALGDVQVLHMDDFYEGWSGGLTPDVWDRLRAQVLEPLRSGRHGLYEHYDWGLGRFAGQRAVPLRPVLVIEGVGSAARPVHPLASLLVWVEAPEPTRTTRGIARDGEAMRADWLRWIVRENAHFERDRTRERADLVVDGTTGNPAAYAVIEDRRPS
jgi:cytidylate kinase